MSHSKGEVFVLHAMKVCSQLGAPPALLMERNPQYQLNRKLREGFMKLVWMLWRGEKSLDPARN